MGYLLIATSGPSDYHHWLEYVSWAGSGVMAVAAIFALWQIRSAIIQAQCALDQNKTALEQLKVATSQLELSRKDIVLRSRREALALTFQQCELFATDIIPKTDAIIKELTAKQFKSLFSSGDFPFIPQPPEYVLAIWKDTALREKIVGLLNKMEAYAMYFVSGLADEEGAFTPTAASFCHCCEHLSVFIGCYRKDNGIKLYQNIVKLYAMWKPRIEETRSRRTIKSD